MTGLPRLTPARSTPVGANSERSAGETEGCVAQEAARQAARRSRVDRIMALILAVRRVRVNRDANYQSATTQPPPLATTKLPYKFTPKSEKSIHVFGRGVPRWIVPIRRRHIPYESFDFRRVTKFGVDGLDLAQRIRVLGFIPKYPIKQKSQPLGFDFARVGNWLQCRELENQLAHLVGPGLIHIREIILSLGGLFATK
jgi:hypothetical protein